MLNLIWNCKLNYKKQKKPVYNEKNLENEKSYGWRKSKETRWDEYNNTVKK